MGTRRALRSALPPALALLTLLLVWQAYAVLGPLGPDVLPSPARVAAAGWELRGALARAAGATLGIVAAGFALSVATAFALSVALDASGWVRRAVLPLLVGSQTLPVVVLAPLIVVSLGFGWEPRVLVVVLVTFFPVIVGLLDGYARADPATAALLRTMGAGRWTEFRLLRLPSALPGLFTGLRIAVTYAVVAAVIAEYAGATRGLGPLMEAARGARRTDMVFAAVAVTAALTLVLYGLVLVAERLAAPWHAAERRRP